MKTTTEAPPAPTTESGPHDVPIDAPISKSHRLLLESGWRPETPETPEELRARLDRVVLPVVELAISARVNGVPLNRLADPGQSPKVPAALQEAIASAGRHLSELEDEQANLPELIKEATGAADADRLVELRQRSREIRDRVNAARIALAQLRVDEAKALRESLRSPAATLEREFADAEITADIVRDYYHRVQAALASLNSHRVGAQQQQLAAENRLARLIDEAS